MNKIPEECKLIAVHTGDGWSLEVHQNAGDIDDELVAYLAWPKQWPEIVSSKQLEVMGFEVV